MVCVCVYVCVVCVCVSECACMGDGVRVRCVRIFFMACAELFGFEQGQEWVVGHFLFKKKVV